MPTRVYLDWNATTPLRPEARAAMVAAYDLVGNPSSVHAEGREARRLVEEARAVLAAAVGALPRNVIFTSAGTEANALALSPGLRGPSGGPVERLLVSAVEHASVLAGGRFPADRIGPIRVTRSGVVDLEDLKAQLKDGPPALVSIMAANNETGALQPIAEAASVARGAGGLLHVDAIQALGKIPFDINKVGADLATFSAHKIGGPKGVGALVMAEGIVGLEPVLRGGGQELSRRAGTENVAGVAGFGAAVKAALQALPEDVNRMATLRDRLENGLRSVARVTVFSDDVERLPNTVLFTAPDLKAETAVIGFDLEGVAVSSGSACSSGKVQPSHVLSAMGYDPAVAQGAVRLSLGWSTGPEDINRALEAWRKLGNTLLKG
ncbi:cysteine desulfurase [Bradyrhizobium sp. R2.2-H]|jgi:cysteine desulfurase|uniref:cysteine desulfurase family protein n=1 Tax=unclassified Bradyrhizobium TaxID=2631580 RepID=UPI00104D9E1E|nr:MULTISPECIES: cysteine desulfurase family protein [unclassified Bradyrhizobium]TCU74964.1 cysteine desulfurase [Bradyrhizobium sp. Y-H1]TCU77732.1 cysteine desulfurase [Bradyrhizobium sp. R2.2-H]